MQPGPFSQDGPIFKVQMIRKIQGGTFQDEPFHAYYDDAGNFVPSITQVLKLQGLSDYSGIDPDVLENAARRGTEVHALAAAYNRYGEIDPDWITEETRPYFDAYMQFLADSGFKPDPAWVETPIIATVHGFKIGITPDCFGVLGKYPAIIEFKATAAEQPSWAVQTAIQECGIFNSNHCGRVRRHALMLLKTGKYRLLAEYTNHVEDLANGIAALRNVWWRIQAGQKLQGHLG